ncbi:MAG: phage tail tape measure protein [Bacteroidales bacterium]
MANTYTRRINLYINGQEVKNDIASIKSEMNKLTAQQARMTRGSEEYVQAGNKIRLLRGIIQEHNDSLRTTSNLWDKLGRAGDAFNRYFSMFVTLAAGLGGILYAGKQAISTFAQFDDKVGDMMKTTGLAKDRVYAMNEELKKMNTRTAQMELLDLGKVAGKLGMSSEKDVMGFIRAADKINVALKEDLGGDAEQAINEVGKLVDIFKVKEQFGIEDSMLKVGSAINALGAASTANEGYIVEFSKRVAGIAPSAGVNIQAVMGLAATLDQLGQTSEISSTVYSAVMTGMFKDTEIYARIAGMGIKDFSALLKKDANEAFIKLLEGLNGNNSGMEQLIAKMDGMGLEGKRSIAVLGVLANNTDLLRESQGLSNKEFEKGTSLTNEFNVKNETAQAKLDKASKSLSNMTVELGQKLMPVLTVSTSGMGYFVRSVSVLTDFFIKHSKAIIVVSSAMGMYILRQQALVAWESIKNISLGKGIIITNLQGIAVRAQILLTGEATMAQKRAIVVQNEMNASMMKSPWGLILAGVAAAVTAYIQFKNTSKDVTDSKQTEIELLKQHTDAVYNEKFELNSLVNQIMNTNEKSAIRIKLLKELQEKYPDFLKNVNAEKVSNSQLAEILSTVNEGYEQKIRLAALQAKNESIQKKMIGNSVRQLEIEGELREKRSRAITAGSSAENDIKKLETEYQSLDDLNKTLQKQMNDFTEQEKNMKSEIGDNSIESLNKRLAGVNYSIKVAEQQLKDAKEAENADKIKFYTDSLKQYTDQKKLLEEQIKNAESTANGSKKDKNISSTFTPDTKDKKKYSLNDDIEFLKASFRLKENYQKGLISSEDEFNRKMRDAEIKALEDRIKTGKDNGEALLNIQNELQNKRIENKKEELKREKELLDASKEGMSDIDKERFAYEQRLIDLKLFGKNVLDMTESELKAYISLQKAHNDKMNKLDADAIAKEIERKQTAFDNEFEALRAKHAEELNSFVSFAEAKSILAETMSIRELKKIKTLDQAKKEISKLQLNEEIKLQTDYLKDLEKQLVNAMNSGVFEGISLTDSLLSDEEIQVLQDKINEVKKILGGLKTASKDGAGEEAGAKADRAMSFHNANKTDILGFTADDWEALYTNLEQGKLGVNEITMATTVLMDAWKTYNNFLTASENKELKKYEKQANTKKEKLQQQLDAGVISQEAYNAQVKALDADLEAKKEEIANKQAKRDSMLAMASIIQNTAAAIMQLWVKPGFPAAIPLAIMVGALGAFQLATVAASLPGAEEGGYLKVVRAQDGKIFKAKKDTEKRGFVHAPTVITGENGSEYIAPAEAVKNPTIRPILDILEMSRQKGTLATLNFPAVMDATYNIRRGREEGGFVETKTAAVSYPKNTASSSGVDKEWKEIVKKNTEVIKSLQKKLDDPIQSYVNMHGKNGLAAKLDEYYKLQKNASI